MSNTPRMDAVIANDNGGSDYIANLARAGMELERELAALQADIKPLHAAARCIRHWHDSDEGMVVSKKKVFLLWEALREFEKKHPELPR